MNKKKIDGLLIALSSEVLGRFDFYKDFVVTDKISIPKQLFFFYLDFLSQTFTNHRTAGEEAGRLFNSSLPLPLASQTLRH